MMNIGSNFLIPMKALCLVLFLGPNDSLSFTAKNHPCQSITTRQSQYMLSRPFSQEKLYLSDIPNVPFETGDLEEEEEEGGDESGRLTDEELEATLEDWDDTIPRFNTIHLTGRLGNDPEPRYFDDGKVVVNLSLATQRKYHNMERMVEKIKSGEEETDWYGLEIWGQTAEFVSKYVDKGMRVGVIGVLQIDQWNDKVTNEPRSRPKVIVRDFDILETRAESEARRSRSGNQRGPAFYRSDGGGYDDDDGGPSSAGTGGFFD